MIGPRRTERLSKGGLILGAFKDAEFEQNTMKLDPDDLLVVFSDGVTEALNVDGVEFGEERLLACAITNRDLPPPVFLERLLETIRQFTVGQAQNDDLTALVLRQI